MTAIVLGLVLLNTAAATPNASCAPQPAVQDALLALKADETVVGRTRAEREALRAGYEQIAAANPDDLHAQEALARFLSTAFLEEALPKSKQAAASGEAKALYLHAALLTKSQGVEASQLLQRALEKDPTLAPAQLRLATLNAYHPKLISKKDALAHLQQFRKLCPSSLEHASLLGTTTPPEAVGKEALALRKALQGRADDAPGVRALTSLWSLEFAAVKVAEHGEVRQRVTADVERLRKLPPRLDVLLAVMKGLKSTSADGVEAVENDLIQRYPRAQAVTSLISARCKAKNPEPGAGTSPEKREAYWREVLEATAACTRSYPSHPLPWARRLDALTQVKAPAREDALATAKQVLAGEGNDYVSPNAPLAVADLYVRNGWEKDKVVALVERGLAELQESEARNKTDGRSAEVEGWVELSGHQARWLALELLARHHLDARALPALASTLDKMDGLLKATTPKPGGNAEAKSAHTAWTRTAQLQRGDVEAVALRAPNRRWPQLVPARPPAASGCAAPAA